MTHATADEELEGQAALYALGALDAEEARAFESHLAEGCAACEAELREFQGVVADLAYAAPAAEPPAGARARLLALVSEGQGQDARAEAQTRLTGTDAASGRGAAAKAREASAGDEWARPAAGGGFLVVRAGEGEWR